MGKVYIITRDTYYMDKKDCCIEYDTDIDKVFSSMESCCNEIVNQIQKFFDMLDSSLKEKFEHKYLDSEGNIDRESVARDLDDHLFIEFYNDGFICESIWIYVRYLYS